MYLCVLMEGLAQRVTALCRATTLALAIKWKNMNNEALDQINCDGGEKGCPLRS